MFGNGYFSHTSKFISSYLGMAFSCVVSQGKHLAKADKDRLYEDGDWESFPGKVFYFSQYNLGFFFK